MDEFSAGIVSDLKHRLIAGKVALEINEEAEVKLAEFLTELYAWSEKMHLVGRRNLAGNILNSTLDSILMMNFFYEGDKRKEREEVYGAGQRRGEPVSREEVSGAGRGSGGGAEYAEEGKGKSASSPHSLAFRREIGLRVADIGTGAGFPGFVWGILQPKNRVVLFERREKIGQFLARTIRILGIENVVMVGEDAANYLGGREKDSGLMQQYRSESAPDQTVRGRVHGERTFDIVTAKASGRLKEMAPIAESLLSEGGVFVTIKGSRWRKELRAIDAASRLFLERHERLLWGRGTALLLRKR